MTNIIAISGASGSGKSTFAKALKEYYEQKGIRVHVMTSDRYFKKELPKIISPADGCEYPDWNHPDSISSGAFIDAVAETRDSDEYDYIIVEGVNIFCYEAIRELADVKIYVDASPEMRIYRRIARNVVLMGQTIEFIGEYYLKCARYREMEYSLPSAKYADWHVDNEWGFDTQAEAEKITEKLNNK